LNQIRDPDPASFFKKNDFGHCLGGILAGLVMLVLVITNLSLFFGIYVDSDEKVRQLPNLFI
jgi:hypothetical protein